MNLSNLVHGGRQQFEPQQQQHSYSPDPSNTTKPSSSSSQYTTHHQSQQPSYQYSSIPQPPPSPPVDESNKFSLPSISSLLSLSDSQGTQEQQQHTVVSSRPGSGHQQYASSPRLTSRPALPPTPPMQVEAGYERRQSPGAMSTSAYSVSSAPNYSFQSSSSTTSFNNLEPHTQRQAMSTASRRVSMPGPSQNYAQSPYTSTPQYSPSSQSLSSYYSSPMHPAAPQSQAAQGLYYQRPLPQQFPPQMMPVAVSLTPSSGANMWQHQHHHYISPSSAAAFPQSQDRYICQTCNKAFSRPSSLRIHSHSHTGEKPFRCSHKGCEKAFSVRSNMKRHERGCHEGTSM